MGRISIYGLGSTGKSCYIYAMTRVMGKGLGLPGNKSFKVGCRFDQLAQLNAAYNQLVNGIWPTGTGETVTYDYNCLYCYDNIYNFKLNDYRGSIFFNPNDLKEYEALMNDFGTSDVLFFFIDAGDVKNAMQGDIMGEQNIAYVDNLLNDYRVRFNRGAPIMLVVTKSDKLSADEKAQANEYLKDYFAGLFKYDNPFTVGLTFVQLGHGLKNVKGELEGQLDIRPGAGNLHIPILYALYMITLQQMEKTNRNIMDFETTKRKLNNEIREAKNTNSFVRWFKYNMDAMNDSLVNCIGEERKAQENLMKMCQTMESLREELLKGAEVYVRSVKME